MSEEEKKKPKRTRKLRKYAKHGRMLYGHKAPDPNWDYKKVRVVSFEQKVESAKALQDFLDGMSIDEVLYKYSSNPTVSRKWLLGKVKAQKGIEANHGDERDRYTIIFSERIYVLRIRCFKKWKTWFMAQDSEEFPTNQCKEYNHRFYDTVDQCIEAELLVFKQYISNFEQKCKNKTRELKDDSSEEKNRVAKLKKKDEETLLDLSATYNALLEFKRFPKIKRISDDDELKKTPMEIKNLENTVAELKSLLIAANKVFIGRNNIPMEKQKELHNKIENKLKISVD